MKSIRRLATMAFLCLFLALSLGIVLFATSACSQDGQENTLSGTYYADVDDAEYTFVFDGTSFTFTMDGEPLTGTYVYDGSALTLTFNGDASATAEFDGDILKVTYNGVTYEMLPRIEYIVTFDLDGGEGTESATVVNGRKLARPADPVKAGFVFIAWYQDSAFENLYSFDTPVTGNMTLYARFAEDLSEEEFVVSFDAGSDYTGEAIADTETIGGCVYLLPELPAQGSNAFLGWWMSDSQNAAKLTAKVEDGQKLDEDTTLYAVWDNGAPAVSVTSEGVSWLSMGVNVSYTVTILGPDGEPTPVNGQITSALTQAFDFASADAGEYVVTVAAKGKTTTAYYTNKQLARVSLFKVEGSTLIFNEVANAEYYLLSYTCGTVGHTHTDFRLDAASYDFSDCEMIADGFSFVVKAVAEGYVTSVSAPYVFERHLEQVTGIAVDTAKDVLTWDAADNATSYIITIETDSGTKTFTVQELSFDLQSFYGTLNISVSAAAHGYNASAAATYAYEKTRLSTPANIRTSNDSIVWDVVSGATGYIVSIGDQKYTVTENKFTPEDLTSVGSEFTVTVQAVAAAEADNSFAASAVVSRELTNIVYADGTLSWNPVIGVSQYGVRVNGGNETIVEDASRVAVALTQAGQNVLEVRYYLGSKPSKWIGINVDASVTVTLDNNAGTGSATSELYFAANDHILLPSDAERLGYTFNGWYTSATGGQKVESGSVTATANVTYYAQWKANTYVVTLSVPESEGYFESGSDQVYTMQVDVTFGSTFTLPVPYSKDGSRAFYGWYSEFGGTGTQYTDPEGASQNGFVWNLIGDRTFYPKWVEAFTYTLITNPSDASQKSYSISQGLGINYLTKVTVPAVYNGLPVTTIESECFARCAKLETIHIPDSIVQIFMGENGSNSTGSAFYNCTGLKEIVVYDASSYISGNYQKYYSSENGVLIYDNPYNTVELAFVPLGITGELTIPDAVKSIPAKTFSNTKITAVNIPASVTHIGNAAFNSSRITKITFLPVPEGTEAQELVIEEEAFIGTSMEEITLPARLTNFNVNIFTSCDELEMVNIEETESGTSTYTSENGVVFTDKGATLYYCPTGRSGKYTIPAQVTRIGERAFYKCVNLEGVVIPGNVMSIGQEAFYGCQLLSSLVFEGTSKDPELSIGESAFYGCASLSSLSLPENLKVLEKYAFGNIAGLIKVTVNTTLEEISYDNGAFADTKGNTYVRTLVLGPSVAVFDINGVFGSAVLTSVEVDPSNPNFEAEGGVLFNKGKTRIVYYPSGKTGSYELPATVQEIGANVFYSNVNLTSIEFGPNLTTIDESAFESCTALEEIIFNSSDTAGGTLVIGKKAFYKCSVVRKIVLPTGKESITIGDEAFGGCAQLVSIDLPEGVISIGHAAFQYCLWLEEISLPASLQSMQSYSTDYKYTDYISSSTTGPTALAKEGTDNLDVFNNCTALATITVAEGNQYFASIDGVLYGKNAETGAVETLYFSPEKNSGNGGTVTIPSTVTAIKDRAFTSNINIRKVVFEDRESTTALDIGLWIFYRATSLEEISLPSGLTEIPDRMFYQAPIKSIFIPKTVTLIGEGAFFDCTNLAVLEFEEGGENALVIADGVVDSSMETSVHYSMYYGAFAGCTKLTEIVLPERTTEIGDYAFYLKQSNITPEEGLTTVTIPSTVTRIGKYAFALPTLQTVTFTDGGSGQMTIGDYAFTRTSLTSIDLPSTLITIGANAFQNNSSLTTVNMPASIQTIGELAFYSNKNLATVNFPVNCALATISKRAFDGCTSLTSFNLENCTSLNDIGNSAFLNAGLESIKIPASIVTIGSSAFDGCVSLASVEFMTAAAEEGGAEKSNLKSIGDEAFAATALTQMNFPESNSNITLGNYLFSTCNKLTTIHLSTSIVDIGSAFTQCMSISTISVAAGNQNYKGHETEPLLLNVDGTTIVLAYGPVTEEGGNGEYRLPEGLSVIGESAFAGQNGIKKLYIPASVSVIGANAFEYCRTLEEVEFADGSLLTEIGSEAFASCYSLKNIINLPEGLTTIGASAFYYARSLQNVTLPSTLIHVGNYAFQNCVALESVNIPALVSATGYTAQSMFSGCTSLVSVTFSENLNWLPKTLFEDCTALTNIVFPAGLTTLNTADTSFDGSGVQTVDLGGVTSIPNNMFKNTLQLTTIDLSNVRTVGSNAFYASSIREADLSNVTSLGEYAFYNCASLEHVILNDILTTIGSNTFNGCKMLSTVDVKDLVSGTVTTNNEKDPGVVTLPSSLSALGYRSFMNTAIREVTIPRGVTKLSDNSKDNSTSSNGEVFSGCTQLEKVILHDAITNINSKVFMNCGKLATVQYIDSQGKLVGKEGELTLPDSVLIIGNYAFGSGRASGSSLDEGERGTAFKKITIPASVKYLGTYAFQDCLDVTEAVYLTEVSTYGTSATSYSTFLFDSCTSLKRVVLNDNIKSFGKYAFADCTSLATIDIYDPDEDTTTTNEIGVATLPSALNHIETYVFQYTAIREVEIPSSITYLSSSTTTTSTSSYGGIFKGCAQLEKVILPDTLRTIGKETFKDCTALKTVQYRPSTGGDPVGAENELTLPDSLTLISESVFENTGVEKVTIPASVVYIGKYNFRNCTSLNEVQYLTSSVKYSSSSYSASLFEGCTSLTKVVLNSKVSYLPEAFFKGCTSLTTIQLYNAEDTNPTGNEGEILLPALTTIAKQAFYGCESISKVILPSTLTDILGSAFNGATSLASVELPEGLKSIGADAFYNTGLSEITIPSTVTSIGDNATRGLIVSVASGNTSFAAMDGILMSVSGVIYSVPDSITGDNGVYTVPAEVTSINGYALNGISGITELTVSTDQLSDYSFAYFYGDVIVTLGESKSIPAYAFSNYRGKSVTLPEGLTTIGDHAFYGAVNLVNVNIPSTVNSTLEQIFRDCSSLVSITIPEGVEVMDGYNFNNCTSLESVTLPSTLKEMGNSEFEGCTKLTSVILPENLQTVGDSVFEACTMLKEVTILSYTDTAWDDNSFSGCTSLEKIVLGDGVTVLPEYMFYKVTSLKEVVIPDSITSIGKNAFYGTNLTSVVIPADVTSIGTYAFANSAMLETVYIPEGVTLLDKNIFQNCTSLKNIYAYRINEQGEMELLNQIEEGVADLSCITTINANAFENCTSLSGVIFSENLTTLSSNSFKASGLKSVTIPGSIGALTSNIFTNCVSLETVVIEEGITELGSSLFEGCTALANVTLPESLVKIGTNAFSGCVSVKELVLSANVATISANPFKGWTADQKIVAYVYALDSACAWGTSSLKLCDAAIEFIVLYSYENDAEADA